MGDETSSMEELLSPGLGTVSEDAGMQSGIDGGYVNRERELCKKQNDPYLRPKNSNATLYALGSQTSECTSLISVLAKIPARQGLLRTAKPINTCLLNW